MAKIRQNRQIHHADFAWTNSTKIRQNYQIHELNRQIHQIHEIYEIHEIHEIDESIILRAFLDISG